MPGDLIKFQTKLGYQFKNVSLLQQALDHRVYRTGNGIRTSLSYHPNTVWQENAVQTNSPKKSSTNSSLPKKENGNALK